MLKWSILKINVFPFDHVYILKSFYFTPEQINTQPQQNRVERPPFSIIVWFEVADTRPVAHLEPLLLPGLAVEWLDRHPFDSHWVLVFFAGG